MGVAHLGQERASTCRVKATGDVEAAKALVDTWVTGDKKALVHLDEIRSRLASFPRGSMVYEVRM
ncbi:MAG TPA: hypothetical protein PKK50_09130 [Myxococcota bacterium]|nr:hypothetical protein [Myxococcota bacterium]